ncbi:ceramide glucosyltransferase-B-like [Acanthaster planci]|uniref:ceramide glucosyltransferase n=1 Tax=Acanthaster planci TaxID=133434 RepID=A0A8B7YHW1_ACAPL|nr:ceramide glucosyltransferase-B-like [Acanthaster planci]
MDYLYSCVFGLACFFVCLEIVCLYLFHFMAIIYIKLTLHKRPVYGLNGTLPGVSILKPLVGIEENLEGNLETFFTLDYPKFELLFGVHTPKDPARKVVESLMKRYPHVDAKLFVGGMSDWGKIRNPKVNNMMPGYMVSRYDLILISDSGIKMHYPNTLTQMVHEMKPDVGFVHGLPFCCNREGFGGTLDKAYFGGSHARLYLSMNMLGITCVTGMFNLVRRSVISAAGGFEELAKYISEDCYMGRATVKSGFKIKLSTLPAMQNPGDWDTRAFDKRMVRWTTVRRSTIPSTIILEPISEMLVCGLCCAWAVHYLFDWNPLLFIVLHILQWFLLDCIQLYMLQTEPFSVSKLEFVLAWIYREFTTPYFFLKGCLEDKVTWRTGKFQVTWGGFIEKVYR